jgi:hypothetical protein
MLETVQSLTVPVAVLYVEEVEWTITWNLWTIQTERKCCDQKVKECLNLEGGPA